MDAEYRFDVFGRVIGVVFKNNAWKAHHFGQEGKRRRADFEIQSFVTPDELLQYLDDLFHGLCQVDKRRLYGWQKHSYPYERNA
ncbi:hypothetical protein ACFSHT_17290 [Paraburkholderia silviterrae]|uniref:DUF7661 domain-containing protein n=1 Tax=Paraburkholderia silviterrae TaxID=2528715 RepID=A0A4R5LZ18_9BURK|nr:hypothetical protein [Paraburkholderia silviterrae]TDG17744.1 hypothetical protein EYW47_36605 [Paraburkholderia silviterrae]